MGETDDRHDVLLEQWFTTGESLDIVLAAGQMGEGLHSFGADSRVVRIRAEVAAAAPTMVRALLWAEVWDHDLYGPVEGRCGCCDARAREYWLHQPVEHEPDCALDAALKQAGFPDHASREAARRMMREAKR